MALRHTIGRHPLKLDGWRCQQMSGAPVASARWLNLIHRVAAAMQRCQEAIVEKQRRNKGCRRHSALDDEIGAKAQNAQLAGIARQRCYRPDSANTPAGSINSGNMRAIDDFPPGAGPFNKAKSAAEGPERSNAGFERFATFRSKRCFVRCWPRGATLPQDANEQDGAGGTAASARIGSTMNSAIKNNGAHSTSSAAVIVALATNLLVRAKPALSRVISSGARADFNPLSMNVFPRT